jgi:hypothetical protein
MRFRWDKLGAKIGVGVCLVGFVFIFVGWNGAASHDRLASQFPYLISGGLAGLGLIVLGAALIVVETSREERDRLTKELGELRGAIEQMGVPSPNGERRAVSEPAAAEPAGRAPYVAGERSYHRATCRLLEGRGALPRVTAEQAADRQLVACRVCEPPAYTAPEAPTRSRRARA